jgi:hypothetical protein
MRWTLAREPIVTVICFYINQTPPTIPTNSSENWYSREYAAALPTVVFIKCILLITCLFLHSLHQPPDALTELQ